MTPPITTTQMALDYKEKLESLEPNVKFLMTLFLSPELTVEEVVKAKKAGILGTVRNLIQAYYRRQVIPKVLRIIYIFDDSEE